MWMLLPIRMFMQCVPCLSNEVHCCVANVTFLPNIRISSENAIMFWAVVFSMLLVLVWSWSVLLFCVLGIGCGTWKEGVPPDQVVYALLFKALRNVIERYVRMLHQCHSGSPYVCLSVLVCVCNGAHYFGWRSLISKSFYSLGHWFAKPEMDTSDRWVCLAVPGLTALSHRVVYVHLYVANTV